MHHMCFICKPNHIEMRTIIKTQIYVMVVMKDPKPSLLPCLECKIYGKNVVGLLHKIMQTVLVEKPYTDYTCTQTEKLKHTKKFPTYNKSHKNIPSEKHNKILIHHGRIQEPNSSPLPISH